MSQPYIGQILMFAGNFAPAGWAFCAGQLMPISENDTLFNLIGTTYGGDGQSTFGLPDMRGRVVIHQGQGGGLSNYNLAQTGGSESVTLITQQIPSHNHFLIANSVSATGANPAGNQTVAFENVNQSPMPYSYYPYDGSGQVTMPSNSIGASGGNQPHDNIQPILALNFCISLFGVYPTPT
jgi:microcystin-dependent protein